MKSKVWLLISGALLISIHLQADDSDYSNRQFSVNPGNMMGGMFNPMRNFFGGSNRYSDDYYNYRYTPPPAYQPGYGYPGAAHGYPPVHPGFQPLPQAGGYSTSNPRQQPPAPTVNAEPPQTPSTPSYGPAVSDQPVYGEQFRFRPLNNEQLTGKTMQATTKGGAEISVPATGQPLAPLSYPATQQPVDQTTGTQGMHSMEQNFRPNPQLPSGTQQNQMKFRPLDKPGYSE
ncbi:MAG: hypothetical protein AB2792_15055 [Candidatus Thiodiazotropha sp.]